MFQIDGPVVSFFSFLCDMIILNILWIICCVPIVTIGPATIAAHYVAMKLVRDEGRSVKEIFFKSFFCNLKQGMLLGIIFTFVGIILGVDLYICIYVIKDNSIFRILIYSAIIFLILLYLIEMIYLWAVLAMFDTTSIQAIINAFIISVSNIKDTSVMLAGDIVIVLVAIVSIAFIPQLAILFIIFGVPLIFVLNSFKLRKIMDKLTLNQ